MKTKFFVVLVADGFQKFWLQGQNAQFRISLENEVSHKIFDSLEDVFFAFGHARRDAGRKAGNESCLSEFFIKSFSSAIDWGKCKIQKMKEHEKPMPDNRYFSSFIFGSDADGKFVKKIAQIFPVVNMPD